MCLLSHLPPTSLFPLLQSLREMDCKADNALSFLMNLKRNVHFKSGLNKIQPQTHLQVTRLFSGVSFYVLCTSFCNFSSRRIIKEIISFTLNLGPTYILSSYALQVCLIIGIFDKETTPSRQSSVIWNGHISKLSKHFLSSCDSWRLLNYFKT